MLVSVTCTKHKCANEGIEYLVSENPKFVECGGCKTTIEPVLTDIPEPELPIFLEPKVGK